jgi:hypothetical protein
MEVMSREPLSLSTTTKNARGGEARGRRLLLLVNRTLTG